MGALTALAVDKAKPGPTRREIADGSGLYLIVQPSGARSWAFRYRNREGLARKLTLGSAPAVTLEKARQRARKAATDVDEGKDPAAEKSAERAAKRPSDTNKVEVVVEAFIERHAKEKTRERTWRETKRILELELVGPWQGKPLSSIRKADVHKLVDTIMDRGKPAAAIKALQVIRPFFKWAVKRGVISIDPCAGVDPPSTYRERERTLTDAELVIVWRAAAAAGYPFGPIVKLLILLGQRREEVAGMRRSELDLDAAEWTLPATRAKNGRTHVVPLPSAAVEIIRGLPPASGDLGLLFTTTGTTPVSGFGKAKPRLDRWIAENVEDVQMEPWTLHDLRRSFATGCAALGVAPHVVEAVLNHKSGVIRGVAKIYNRHHYLPEKRAALETWALHLEMNIGGAGA